MNQILESVYIALGAIWANKLRSFMTVLGNIVAVTSIVTVVTLIQGMNAMVSTAIISDVGADSFTIQRQPPIRNEDDEERTRNNPILTMDEADAIRAFSPLVTAVMGQTGRGGTVSYRNTELNQVTVQAVTDEYINFSNFNAERGRLMSPTEVSRGAAVAVIGWDTADRLFGQNDPLEKTIRVEGMPFRVVGVSKKQGSFFGNSQDTFVIMSLVNFQKIYGTRQSLQIVVKPRSADEVKTAMDDATVALRVKRRLKPGERDNFGIFTSDTFLNLYKQATSGIFAVLVGVVALSLVVGGIVIMNIMLMVVTERTREIGLRKALGARRADILSQVLTESVTLSILGGIVGITLGFLAALTIAAVTPLPARLEPWSVVLGIGITAGVGLFFGIYPASRAAALDPIEALRRE
ncbi:MAG TPA: ABC transporter permease [Vicinamibacterales bacterium]|jgi:putative ABC transport system permease protein|nr:ABC transporter permease [Vicinamibacterales bacterium]